jgi:FkbM family methyltransferase
VSLSSGICSTLSWGYARDYRPHLAPGLSGKMDYFEWRILGPTAAKVAKALYPNDIRVTFRGTRFILDPRSRHDLRLAMVLHSGRAYEPATLQAITRSLRPGGTFVDVGANTGFFTAMVSRHLGPTGRVLAFEPNPAAYSRLVRNVEANGAGNVATYNVGLSDTKSTAILRLHEADDGTASLHIPAGREFEVSLARGDELLEFNPDLVKVDVEGHELAVVRGLAHRLDDATLIVEWNPGYARDALYEELSNRFRHVSAIAEDRDGSLLLIPITRGRQLTYSCNLLCTSRDGTQTDGQPALAVPARA